jgi:hypothetical protein
MTATPVAIPVSPGLHRRRTFGHRLALALILALGLLTVALGIGVLGYHFS